MDKGRNGGITGVVDIVGAPQFTAKVVKFTISAGAAKIDTTGEGSGGDDSSRSGNENGGLVLLGKVLRQGFPVPAMLANAGGTIKIQYDTTISVTETIRVDSYKIDFDEKTETMWDIALVCSRIGAPVWTGWTGNQANPSPPAAAAKYLYAGRQKVVDSHGIVDSSTQTIDVTGLTDNDAGEIARLAAILTAYATPPQSGEKLYTSTVTRTDYNGMRIVLTWKPTDSADDVTLPQTITVTDSNNLTSHAAVAAINSTPTTLSGFARRPTTVRTLNTANILSVTEFGLRSTVEDITFPGTYVNTDPNDLESEGRQTVIAATASPPSATVPSGLKLTGTIPTKLTSAGTPQSQTVFEFNKLDSKDKLILPRTFTRVDPNGLRSEAGVAEVDGTPSVPGGYKLRFTRTDNPTGDHTLTSLEVGLTDTLDDIVIPPTQSFRSAQAPSRDSVGGVLSSALTTAAAADAAWASFQSTLHAMGVTMKPVAGNNKLIVYEYMDPGIMVEGYTMGGNRVVEARINSGNLQVFVSENLSRGTGYRRVTLARVRIASTPIRRFVLRRSLQGTTIPEQGPSTINSVTMPLIGQANSSPFLGTATGMTVYEGPLYSTQIGLSSTFPFFMGYQFFNDANGVFDQLPQDWFLHPLTLATSVTSTGWVTASTLSLVVTPIQPTTASFAAFTA